MTDGDIDWESFARQIEYCIDGTACMGMVVPALASEFFTLSDAERQVKSVAFAAVNSHCWSRRLLSLAFKV